MKYYETAMFDYQFTNDYQLSGKFYETLEIFFWRNSDTVFVTKLFCYWRTAYIWRALLQNAIPAFSKFTGQKSNLQNSKSFSHIKEIKIIGHKNRKMKS